MSECRMMVLIYESEIRPDVSEEKRRKWRELSWVIDGERVGLPFVDGEDIAIYPDAPRFFDAILPDDHKGVKP